MKITVIGAGYVGLVSAACFSDFGYEVTCVDRDPRKLALLEGGSIPIYEQGLQPIVAANRAAGRLIFTDNMKDAVAKADVVLIAVGTPTREGEDAADLSFVYAAGEEIAKAMQGFTVIVTKSTVPVGTAAKLRQIMSRARPDGDFEVASNPEFMCEGSAVEDFLRPDRVVVGVNSERAEKVMSQLYRPLTAKNVPLLVTSCEAAEIIKYAANTFLATRIAFVNQLADLCEKVGADIEDVARGMGLDKRIGLQFLSPGPGFGGSCFPKDTRALVHTARLQGHPFSIVENVIAANEQRKLALADRIQQAVGGTLAGKRIALLGIAAHFKTESDEERAHAQKLMDYQIRRGGRVALAPLAAPLTEFAGAPADGDALHAYKLALSLEKLNYAKLRALHDVASGAGDTGACTMVEDMLAEQEASVKAVADAVAQLRRVGPGLGTWQYDKQLA